MKATAPVNAACNADDIHHLPYTSITASADPKSTRDLSRSGGGETVAKTLNPAEEAIETEQLDVVEESLAYDIMLCQTCTY
jgi:hypothetical protein